MITELVLFNLPEGMTREQVVSNYRQTTQKWRANPHLIRKNYLFNGEARQGGGVYLWKDVEAAKRWHDDAWRSKVVELYGSEPVISYFETPFVVDNAAQDIVEERLGER
jgi:hypothetical protein